MCLFLNCLQGAANTTYATTPRVGKLWETHKDTNRMGVFLSGYLVGSLDCFCLLKLFGLSELHSQKLNHFLADDCYIMVIAYGVVSLFYGNSLLQIPSLFQGIMSSTTTKNKNMPWKTSFSQKYHGEVEKGAVSSGPGSPLLP